MTNLNFTDSHCHLDKLDMSPYNQSYDDLFHQAKELGVKRFLCIGIDLEHLDEVIALAEKYPFVYASVGSHPCNDPKDLKIISTEKLIELANHPKVIALGETGIDYFHQDKEKVHYQQERLINHIEAARQTKKPLIIHMRNSTEHQKATDDLLSMLKTYGKGELTGVMHCFAEDVAVAKRALDLDFYISFSGIVSFKNAQNLHQVAKFVPSDKYLIETDSPWLAPMPYRGKPNYPHYVYYVAKAVADLREVPLETISQQTESNFNRLFIK